ncbi:MAG: hypothetical protein JW913_01690 [Chitinispirillaceae bacterium]|nr:hypothetical protein [Chitinispirillaceae bacterium]
MNEHRMEAGSGEAVEGLKKAAVQVDFAFYIIAEPVDASDTASHYLRCMVV